ncbi:Major facilitator superfamily transporter [Purpureocillium lavendulum]|uniref:Major facilitator superfamily transporter n=1 Tax=Purpureocillium lavendulum TaxID=1247861 RepID=A0AB34FKJ5_9HYPO|nr:Major facilitator superfamily transporter [Purpureocillium lavendulum]
MATKAAQKRLTREYKTISENPPPYITAHPSESNILEWHYIITGPEETPYHGGQYWGTLMFPPNYPFAPPAIRMHTPSGRFQPSTRLCLSISDFHPKSFNPAWEVSTILIGLLSFMTSDEMTTGSVSTSAAERRYLASKSRWWNSTGGGSHVKNPAQKGNVKAGDGGAKFRAEWPEVDAENWEWIKKSSSGNQAQAVVVAVVQQRDAGRGWIYRNKLLVAGGLVFIYVLISRLLHGEGLADRLLTSTSTTTQGLHCTMAPPNGSSKPRKAGAPKQPAKPVVPALPLPYVKRQAAAAAAAASKTASPLPMPPETKDTIRQVDGAAQVDVGGQSSAPGTQQREAESPAILVANETSSSGNRAVETNGHEPRAVAASSGEAPGLASQTTSEATRRPAEMQAAEGPIPQPSSDRHSETAVAFETVSNKSEHTQKPSDQHIATATLSRPAPAVSPTRYQMPPPFQPANRPMAVIVNGDLPRGPRPHPPNGAHHLHQPHPSNGSIHFGAFHGSQNSSPAPPHSGGVAPPPGMAGPDGRPGFMGHASNGFPPMIPYSADMIQPANFDSYGRPAMGYGPVDQYHPYGNNFAPSTPHSFHDSQSSAHPEESGIYNTQFPAANMRSGGAIPGEEMHTQSSQARLFGPLDYRMMPNVGPPPLVPHGDHADGLVGFMQQQFASPELADCTLELRYSDDRARPVRIPGHRIIFSRSPQLAALLRGQAFQPGAPEGTLQTLLLESDNKWIRSDAFYMAVQRLYGLPLLPIPPPRGPDSSEMVEAGSASEQFDFALSYAAAGRLLDWVPLIRRGCEVATQLLTWQSIEKALEFALDGHSDNGTRETYKYGEGSRVLLNATVTYIVHNLPPSFNLDTSADTPEAYALLPPHPTSSASSRSAQAERQPSSPTIARGSSVQLGKGRRSQQIANIQFGDLSLSDGKTGPESETPRATRQAQPVSHAILSRVLLNLPFSQLKMILESSGSGNVNGWANSETRYRVIKRAVEEREARRLHAVDAVVNGDVLEANAICMGLRNPNPQDLGRWTPLGWQEELLPFGNPDGPSLERKWVPLMDTQGNAAAEYP